MTVRDILPKTPVPKIEVRTNWPDDYYDGMILTQPEQEWGILLGFCAWDGRKLRPLDGDTYRLDDEIVKHTWEDDLLIYWVESEWA